MPYDRVLPRDLFNEAKLLKCLGQLALLIHSGPGMKWPLKLQLTSAVSAGFRVDQDKGDGCLFVRNLRCSLHGRVIKLSSAYNSKEPYPLLFDDVGSVFNDDGTLSTEFTALLDSINPIKCVMPECGKPRMKGYIICNDCQQKGIEQMSLAELIGYSPE